MTLIAVCLLLQGSKCLLVVLVPPEVIHGHVLQLDQLVAAKIEGWRSRADEFYFVGLDG